jgi:hypothetical protein
MPPDGSKYKKIGKQGAELIWKIERKSAKLLMTTIIYSTVLPHIYFMFHIIQ